MTIRELTEDYLKLDRNYRSGLYDAAELGDKVCMLIERFIISHDNILGAEMKGKTVKITIE